MDALEIVINAAKKVVADLEENSYTIEDHAERAAQRMAVTLFQAFIDELVFSRVVIAQAIITGEE